MLLFIKKLFGRGMTAPPDSSLSPEPPVSPAIRDFLEGRITRLSAADLDPVNAAYYDRYERGMALKRAGDVDAAAALLIQSCQPPSIYTGHYRELFKIWRALNRVDLKAGKHAEVAGRVTTMIRFDDEMVALLLKHWGLVQRKELPEGSFDKSRNLLKSDAKALLTSAEALGDELLMRHAEEQLVLIATRKTLDARVRHASSESGDIS